jgi:hypothetical protein
MDQASKEQFKWKFWILTIILNVIVLLVAIAVIGLFKVPAPYTLPFSGGCLVVAGLLGWKFKKMYALTREWLDEHSGNDR